MPTLPIAAGVEEIIWVVILIFWGIAQMASKARKAKQPPRPHPGRRPTPHDAEVRELMDQLAGHPANRSIIIEEDEDEDEPAAPYARPVPPPTQPQRPRPQPVRATPLVWRPPARPEAPIATPGTTPKIVPRAPSPDFAAIAAITDISDIAPMLTAEQHVAQQLTSRLGSGLGVDTGAMKIRSGSLGGRASLPMLNLAQHHGAPLLNVQELRKTVPLKKAILAKIILDSPRALSPYS